MVYPRCFKGLIIYLSNIMPLVGEKSKTLVIVLAETRASKTTFGNFKQNVLDRLNADLCVCIGKKANYDYTNEFYQTAKYRFLYDEPDDYANAFDHAYSSMAMSNRPRDRNALNWRAFLNIRHPFIKNKNQFLGGIKSHPRYQHPGSAGILLFFRWFLLDNLVKHNLIDSYDRFVVTRSDYLYMIPHPLVEQMDPEFIWIPDSEQYGGLTDRHVVLSRTNVIPYLSILDAMYSNSNVFLSEMVKQGSLGWNLEKLIKHHLTLNGFISKVRYSPYVMFSIREPSGDGRWSKGQYHSGLGVYVKYMSEYAKAQEYKNAFNRSRTTIDDFYSAILAASANKCVS